MNSKVFTFYSIHSYTMKHPHNTPLVVLLILMPFAWETLLSVGNSFMAVTPAVAGLPTHVTRSFLDSY